MFSALTCRTHLPVAPARCPKSVSDAGFRRASSGCLCHQTGAFVPLLSFADCFLSSPLVPLGFCFSISTSAFPIHRHRTCRFALSYSTCVPRSGLLDTQSSSPAVPGPTGAFLKGSKPVDPIPIIVKWRGSPGRLFYYGNGLKVATALTGRVPKVSQPPTVLVLFALPFLERFSTALIGVLPPEFLDSFSDVRDTWALRFTFQLRNSIFRNLYPQNLG